MEVLTSQIITGRPERTGKELPKITHDTHPNYHALSEACLASVVQYRTYETQGTTTGDRSAGCQALKAFRAALLEQEQLRTAMARMQAST